MASSHGDRTIRVRGLDIRASEAPQHYRQKLARVAMDEMVQFVAVLDVAGTLDMAKAFSPHVALLDIGMPGHNGYQVANLLRQTAWGADITLIAMTGWGQEEDEQLAREAGFDRHLTKPFDLGALTALLAQAAVHADIEGRM